MGTTTLVDVKSDVWLIYEERKSYPYSFAFDYLPNEWFKKNIKQITLEQLQMEKLALSTLHRYNEAIKTFFIFMEESNYTLNTFADVSPKIAEEYLHYLLVNIEAKATRALKLASLKHHLNHGRMLDWSDFPINNLFDGMEYQVLQTEDTLKSMVIDDRVMKQIDIALDRMHSEEMSYSDILIWGLVTIIKGTGMRIHEALAIQEQHIAKDLMGKPILEVLSEKTLTDRYIPISHDIVKAIRFVAKNTEWVRKKLDTEFIFVRPTRGERKFEFLQQKTARYLLKKFSIKFDLKTPIGEPFNLNFHEFRHTIGTDLLNNGMSMREVMEFLGHNSSHSTRLYAKVQNERFSKTYRKLGFIGVIEESVDDIVDEEKKKITVEKRLMAQLPDGVCARPIKEQVINCKKPNACLFCPKFITTPEFLEVHKNHLERIKEDKQRYMEENLIGTDYLLFETEKALTEIVTQLEAIQNAKGGNN